MAKLRVVVYFIGIALVLAAGVMNIVSGISTLSNPPVPTSSEVKCSEVGTDVCAPAGSSEVNDKLYNGKERQGNAGYYISAAVLFFAGAGMLLVTSRSVIRNARKTPTKA